MDETAQPMVHVMGHDGRRLTLADLPPSKTTRWVIRRKAEVVAAVRGGLLSLEEACSRYTLNTDEFRSWEFCIDHYGLAGLRTTHTQFYFSSTLRHPRLRRIGPCDLELSIGSALSIQPAATRGIYPENRARSSAETRAPACLNSLALSPKLRLTLRASDAPAMNCSRVVWSTWMTHRRALGRTNRPRPPRKRKTRLAGSPPTSPVNCETSGAWRAAFLGSFEQFMGQNDRLFPPSSVVRKVRMDI